jgi:hypothetical protein
MQTRRSKRGLPLARATNKASVPSSSSSEDDSSDGSFVLGASESRLPDDDTSEEEADEVEPVAATAAAGGKKAVKETLISSWTVPTRDNGPAPVDFTWTPEQELPKLRGPASSGSDWRPWDVFSLLWSFELLEQICKATNSRSDALSPPLSVSELLKWIAISICMGYSKQPRVASYWARETAGKQHCCHKLPCPTACAVQA